MSQKKHHQKDSVISNKNSFDSTPQLVHPDFNIPIIKLDEDLTQIEVSERLDYSDIDRFNHTTNPVDNKSTNHFQFDSDNTIK